MVPCRIFLTGGGQVDLMAYASYMDARLATWLSVLHFDYLALRMLDGNVPRARRLSCILTFDHRFR